MNSERLNEAKKVIADLFGESADPEVIKKFKTVEEALEASDKENTELLQKHADLAKAYKEAILGTGTKVAPEAVAQVAAPKTLDEMFNQAFKAAEEQYKPKA